MHGKVADKEKKWLDRLCLRLYPGCGLCRDVICQIGLGDVAGDIPCFRPVKVERKTLIEIGYFLKAVIRWLIAWNTTSHMPFADKAAAIIWKERR